MIVLGILTRDYDPNVKIIKKLPNMTLFQTNELMRQEYKG